MARQREKQFQFEVQAALDSFCRGRHMVWVTHPDEYEGAGKPDLVGHIYGMLVGIELKVAPNRPSGPQLTWLTSINKTGGFGCLLIKEGNTVWLVVPEVLGEKFSYRDRNKWLPLSTSQVTVAAGKRQLNINLVPLLAILHQRLATHQGLQ